MLSRKDWDTVKVIAITVKKSFPLKHMIFHGVFTTRETEIAKERKT